MSGIKIELLLEDGAFVSGVLRAGQSIQSFKNELIRLDPHFRKVADEASKSGRSLDSFIVRMNRAADSSRTMLSTLRDLSIVGGFSIMAFRTLSGASDSLIGSIIRVNAEMQRLRFQMEGLSSAPDPFADASRSVNYLRDMVSRAPFSLNELNSTFVKLKATGIDPMSGSMQALVDAVAAFGGTNEDLHRVTLGIAQMSGKGVIQMEEMRQQLGEAMPTAMRIMARSMGVSMGELIQAISTGTVDAKGALEKFYAEIERTYGGEANRMMGTFSGQVIALGANLQKLATSDGPMQDFFQSLQDHLKELNNFLGSPEARRMTEKFGQALKVAVDVFAGGVRFIYNFRNELKLLLEVFIAYKSVTIATAAIRGFTTAMGLLNTNLLLFSQRAAGQSLFGVMTSGLGGLKASLTALFARGGMVNGAMVATGGLRMAITTLGGAVMASLTPWGLLAAALGLAAAAYVMTRDRSKEAMQAIEDGEIVTREKAETVFTERERVLKENLQYSQDHPMVKASKSFLGMSFPVRDPEGQKAAVAQAEQDLIDFYESRDKIRAKYVTEEVDKAIKEEEEAIRKKNEGLNSLYNKEQLAEEDRYGAELETAKKSGDNIDKVRTEHQKRMIEIQTRYGQIRISNLEGEEARIRALITTSSGDQKTVLQQTLDFVLAMMKDAKEEMNGLTETGIEQFGIPTVNKVESDDKKWERGRNNLENLQADIKQLQVDASGADGELAKMVYRVERGDFGNLKDASEYTKELTGALIEATAQKESLDNVMDGRRAIESDIERIRQKLADDKAELEASKLGDKATEADKVLSRLSAGYYEALGPIDNIRGDIMGVVEVLNGQGIIASKVADAMKNDAFGQGTVDKITGVNEAILGLTGSMMGLNGQISLIANANFGNMSGLGGVSMITSTTGGIFDLIKQGESGGDYNATLDNGRWTGGARNLTSMTIDEIMALQQQMLANPENRALYGDGKGSSALGAYQIVGKTLAGLKGSMGLTGTELFSPELQDQMAMRLVAGRGGSIAGLRQEWTSLQNVPDAAIMAALQASVNGPTRAAAAGITVPAAGAAPAAAAPAAGSYDPTFFNDLITEQTEKSAEYVEEIKKLKAEELATNAAIKDQAVIDYFDTLIQKQKDAKTDTADLGSNFKKLREDVEKGLLGGSTDINDSRYTKLVQAAKDLDVAEKKITEQKQLQKELDTDAGRLAEKKAELADKMAHPDWSDEQLAVARLGRQLDLNIEKAKELYGSDSDQYKSAVAMKDQVLENVTAADDLAALEAKITQQKQLQTRLEGESTRLREKQVALADEAAHPDWSQEQLDLAKLNRDLDENIAKTKELYGVNSQAYKDAVALKEQANASANSSMGVTAMQDLKDMRKGLGIDDGSRKEAAQAWLDEQMREVDQREQMLRAAGVNETEITEEVEKTKAMIRAKYEKDIGATNQLKQTMDDWKSLTGNIGQDATGWVDGLATNMTDMVMGKSVDMKSMLDGIMNDIVGQMIRYGFSSTMGGSMTNMGSKLASTSTTKGAAGAAGSKAAGAASAGTKAAGIATSAATTTKFAQGGVPGISEFNNRILSRPTLFQMPQMGLAGEAGKEAIMPLQRGPGGLSVLGVMGGQEMPLSLVRTRRGKLGVSLFNARGVRPFAKGGVPGLDAALKDYSAISLPRSAMGDFSSEEMKKMGAFSQVNGFTINSPITVNGSAGTPQQNDDLARKIAREMEGSMRNVVQSEMIKQRRPGNMLAKG